MSTTEVDLADVDRIVKETGKTPDAVIPILRKIQQKYNWLPESALKRVCEVTEITPSDSYLSRSLITIVFPFLSMR